MCSIFICLQKETKKKSELKCIYFFKYYIYIFIYLQYDINTTMILLAACGSEQYC